MYHTKVARGHAVIAALARAARIQGVAGIAGITGITDIAGGRLASRLAGLHI